MDRRIKLTEYQVNVLEDIKAHYEHMNYSFPTARYSSNDILTVINQLLYENTRHKEKE